jgi:hypothetical protein
MIFNSLGAPEFSLHTGGVTGSIPVAPTIEMLNKQFVNLRPALRSGEEISHIFHWHDRSLSPLYQSAR